MRYVYSIEKYINKESIHVLQPGTGQVLTYYIVIKIFIIQKNFCSI